MRGGTRTVTGDHSYNNASWLTTSHCPRDFLSNRILWFYLCFRIAHLRQELHTSMPTIETRMRLCSGGSQSSSPSSAVQSWTSAKSLYAIPIVRSPTYSWLVQLKICFKLYTPSSAILLIKSLSRALSSSVSSWLGEGEKEGGGGKNLIGPQDYHRVSLDHTLTLPSAVKIWEDLSKMISDAPYFREKRIIKKRDIVWMDNNSTLVYMR